MGNSLDICQKVNNTAEALPSSVHQWQNSSSENDMSSGVRGLNLSSRSNHAERDNKVYTDMLDPQSSQIISKRREQRREAQQQQREEEVPSITGRSSVTKTTTLYSRKKLPNGGEFEGECDGSGVPHGKGKYRSPDGDLYEGQFVKGKVEGWGTMTDSNGCQYSGRWLQNKRHGQGVERTTNGDTYEGLFADDEKHGFGRPFLLT